MDLEQMDTSFGLTLEMVKKKLGLLTFIWFDFPEGINLNLVSSVPSSLMS